MAQSDTSDHLLSLRQKMREIFGIPEESITVEGPQAVQAIAFAVANVPPGSLEWQSDP